MPTLEFRGDVIHMLDNDVSTLSNAMDVLVWTMLKMQPGSSNRRRCLPVPMQVASMDALENNVRALGVGSSDDYRSLVRQLASQLFAEKCSSQGVGTSISRSFSALPSSTLAAYQRQADKIAGVSEQMSQLFTTLDKEPDGKITQEEFVSGVRDLLKHKSTALFPEDDIRKVFKYLDSNGDGNVSLVELTAGFCRHTREAQHKEDTWAERPTQDSGPAHPDNGSSDKSDDYLRSIIGNPDLHLSGSARDPPPLHEAKILEVADDSEAIRSISNINDESPLTSETGKPPECLRVEARNEALQEAPEVLLPFVVSESTVS